MNDEVFKACITTYGLNAQIDVCLEEMSELAKALLKFRRNNFKDDGKLRKNIVDEIADVKIMCRQMELLFCYSDEVEKMIALKIERQRKRLEDLGALK